MEASSAVLAIVITMLIFSSTNKSNSIKKNNWFIVIFAMQIVVPMFGSNVLNYLIILETLSLSAMFYDFQFILITRKYQLERSETLVK